MPTVTLPFTLTAGQPENVSQLMDNLTTLRDAMNGTLDTTNLATSAKPVTLLGQYRSIFTIHTEVGSPGATTVGNKVIRLAGADGLPLVASPASASRAFPILYLDPADYAVSGLTAKYRVRATIATNATAPAITITPGLYPVTVAGGAGVLTATLGTVVSGSTAALTTPSASTVTAATGTDFTPPVAAGYQLGVALSGTIAANSFSSLTVELQVHHV